MLSAGTIADGALYTIPGKFALGYIHDLMRLSPEGLAKRRPRLARRRQTASQAAAEGTQAQVAGRQCARGDPGCRHQRAGRRHQRVEAIGQSVATFHQRCSRSCVEPK